jgi:hypothetical protein
VKAPYECQDPDQRYKQVHRYLSLITEVYLAGCPGALFAACLEAGPDLGANQLVGLVVEAEGPAHVAEVVHGEDGMREILEVSLLVHFRPSAQSHKER